MRRNEGEVDPLDGKQVMYELLDREADRQRGDVAERATAVSSRAAVLIGSASIITTLQTGSGGPLFVVTIVLTAAAAVAGIGVLVMRGAKELSIEVLENAMWPMAETAARRDLLYQKVFAVRREETRLRSRARLLNVGFALLTASLISTALHLTLRLS